MEKKTSYKQQLLFQFHFKKICHINYKNKTNGKRNKIVQSMAYAFL